MSSLFFFFFFLFNDTATTEIYTLSLHDALPISATPFVAPQSAPAVPPLGTISAARRSWLPSPVPSPTAPTDDELAATQVGRLLQPQAGVLAADATATVRNEI